ncbi:AAA family ATPase [Clostridium peptidivorans]|uniref:AAA family ATPase n=1 Tax=Clostridium peptidivorans TaxID=100174 RepID=UPI000BE432BE|nr:AAA family ATPase [Clostridium peptidivorans]
MRQSAITQYGHCPYKYKLRYVDNLEIVKNQDANNALYLGTAIHYGAETGSVKKMIDNYYSNYYVLTDNTINEAIKIEYLLPKVLNFINQYDKLEHEVEFEVGKFHGTADLLAHNKDGTVDLYDFKYSNNVEDYLKSPQLHIYKYFLECIGYKVNKMAFIFIPKTFIRQKNSEDLYQFRKRLNETIRGMDIRVQYLEYDSKKVTDSLNTAVEMLESTEFPKNETKLCGWCEHQPYCQRGEDYMNLPSNKRRERKIDTNPDMWVYADSYVGKSTFVDQFDDLLFLNTDGNTDNTTSPVIRIADEVTVEGRITKRKMAWDVFLEVIAELEKKQNDFKRVCIDLVEDLKEHCRLYVFDKNGIQHESDAGYGKGWDLVKTEFFSAIKRLKNLGYQVIYISKEVVSEINLKNGGKITTIIPNIQDKFANVLAGTVDLTVRAYMNGEDRFLLLEKKENVFGGGRFNFKTKTIKLDKDEFIKALEQAQEGIKTYSKMEEAPKEENLNNDSSVGGPPSQVNIENKNDELENSTTEENAEISSEADDAKTNKKVEEAPKRRRRKAE